MALTNPYSITYGDQTVGGGSSTLLLHGPYVFDRSFTNLRLVFDVIVTTSSFSSLKSLSEQLETAFSKRDVDFSITVSGSTWTFTRGQHVLNTTASISKSGNVETDRGYSRAYTISIDAELPATDTSGLRDVTVLVQYEASRRKTVTMNGVYTAISGSDAVAQYQSAFDAEATAYLSGIDNSATWELVNESYSIDRNKASGSSYPHICEFSRQYSQLLYDQTSADLDDERVKDHRVVFTDLSQFPGDALESAERLRRVVGSYDCALDVEIGTDLQSVYDDAIKPYIDAQFEALFSPAVFCEEDKRISYDETSKRLSVSIQYLYSGSGNGVVEASQSLAYRESRQIDYTPVHENSELAAYVDPGWATLERIWSRTIICLGNEFPKRRIGEKPKSGPAGPFDRAVAGSQDALDSRIKEVVTAEGWNVISNTSQASDQWIGDPDAERQIKLSVLTETVTERFNAKPSAIPTRATRRNPVTPGGSSPR